MKTVPTIRDVAREAGVSVTTVSFVLTNGPRPVSAVARAKVEAAIEKLGYVPNAFARSLASKKTNQIGVIFSNFGHGLLANPWGGGILEGILDGGYDLGLGVMVIPARNFSEAVRFAGAGQVDGCILIAPNEDDEFSARFSELGVPYVEVAPFRNGRDMTVPSVDVNNALGTRRAVEYLVALGHERIAHITADLHSQAGQDRKEAFLATMKELGLAVPDRMILPGASSEGSEQIKKIVNPIPALLQSADCPSAIVCGNDWIAYQVIRMAADFGLSVPHDISVVGFDDAVITRFTTPTITTVRQPTHEIGELSLRRLLKVIRGEEVVPKHLELQCEFVIRDSCGYPVKK